MSKSFLDSTTLGFLGAALCLFVIVWIARGSATAMTGLTAGLKLFLRYGLLIASSMVLASLLQTLIPKEFIAKYLGAASGWRGISLGVLVGLLFPGSPYAAMPLFSGLLQMGTSVPTGVAMVCAWGLLSVGRIPFQVAVMGGRFTLIQAVSSLLLPLVAGAIAQLLELLL